MKRSESRARLERIFAWIEANQARMAERGVAFSRGLFVDWIFYGDTLTLKFHDRERELSWYREEPLIHELGCRLGKPCEMEILENGSACIIIMGPTCQMPRGDGLVKANVKPEVAA